MKISKTKNKSRKPALITVVIVLAALIGVSAYAAYALTNDNHTMRETNTSQQETDAGNQAKKDTIDKSDQDSANNTPTDKGEQPSAPQSQEVAMTITASSQSESTYQIRTMISALVSSGTCQLQLTKGGSTVSKSAGVAAFAQTSTCQGFDVPLSELSPGTWAVKASFNGSGKTGSTSSEIEVK